MRLMNIASHKAFGFRYKIVFPSLALIVRNIDLGMFFFAPKSIALAVEIRLPSDLIVGPWERIWVSDCFAPCPAQILGYSYK